MKRVLAVVLLLTQTFALFTIAYSEDTATLVVGCPLTYNLLLEDAVKLFETRYPQINVEIVMLEHDELRSSLYSTDAVADVYIVGSNFVVFDWLIENEKLHCIASEYLIDNVKMMYPQIQEYVIQAGNLWAYPIEMRANQWLFNDEIAQLAEKEMPSTFIEYIELMQWWYENQSGNVGSFSVAGSAKQEYERVITTAIIAYLHAHAKDDVITFSNAEFEAILRKLEFLKHYEKIEENTVEVLFPFSGLSPIGGAWDYSDDVQHVLPPTWNVHSDSVINAYLDFAVISAVSERKALAEAFLECIAEERSISGATELFPYQVALLEDTAESQGKPTESLQCYKTLIAHYCFDQGALIGALYREDRISEIIEKLYNDEYSIEEAIQYLDEHYQQTLDLISNEG